MKNSRRIKEFTRNNLLWLKYKIIVTTVTKIDVFLINKTFIFFFMIILAVLAL